jgi:hypothetical protein
MYKAVSFYSTNSDVYNIFKWYPFDREAKTYDEKLIEKFKYHVEHVISNGREDVARYLHAWFASILKNPTFKTGVAIIIKGMQGTGKNTLTDTWGALLGDYAMPNVSNIDNLTGRFNACIVNKKLITINELKSAENHAIGTADALKTLITEYYMNLEKKCIDVKANVKQVANFIINTNNLKPLTITEDDRRMCVVSPSTEHANDNEYFMPLRESMLKNPKANDSAYREDFLQALFSYYWNEDFSDVDLRQIPQTDARKELIDMSRPFTHYFMARYVEKFENKCGVPKEEAYKLYKNYYDDYGYGERLNMAKFKAVLETDWCAYKQLPKQPNNTRPWGFVLSISEKKRKALEELKGTAISNDENGSIDVEIDDDEELAEIEEQLKELQAKQAELKAKIKAKKAKEAEEDEEDEEAEEAEEDEKTEE